MEKQLIEEAKKQFKAFAPRVGKVVVAVMAGAHLYGLSRYEDTSVIDIRAVYIPSRKQPSIVQTVRHAGLRITLYPLSTFLQYINNMDTSRAIDLLFAPSTHLIRAGEVWWSIVFKVTNEMRPLIAASYLDGAQWGIFLSPRNSRGVEAEQLSTCLRHAIHALEFANTASITLPLTDEAREIVEFRKFPASRGVSHLVTLIRAARVIIAQRNDMKMSLELSKRDIIEHYRPAFKYLMRNLR